MNSKYRLTPARKTILDIFSKHTKPLSAIALQDILKNKNIVVNKTTIYRELDFLLKKRFIKQLYLSSDKKLYESANLKHHHHLICTDCGLIEDVSLAKNILEEEKRFESEKQFKILNHSIEFFGLCADCV
jgi:Fe2+ or Zn2+ uptake regulation protein